MRVLAGAERSLEGWSRRAGRAAAGLHPPPRDLLRRPHGEMKVLSHEANSLTGDRQRKVNAIKRRYVDLLEGTAQGCRAGRGGGGAERRHLHALRHDELDLTTGTTPRARSIRASGGAHRAHVHRRVRRGAFHGSRRLTAHGYDDGTQGRDEDAGSLYGRERRGDHRAGRRARQYVHLRDDASVDGAILKARFADDVHVVVLRGHGDKFFSAGANIGMLTV